jgi:hypothetical protein
MKQVEHLLITLDPEFILLVFGGVCKSGKQLDITRILTQPNPDTVMAIIIY